ncbi:MAG: hypothetical protein LBG14_06350 [Treponema sp.]|jgi:hypothetical protein|nr:hypothetical protein [Treponema sp.]
MAEQQDIALPPGYEGLTFEKVWAMFQETDRLFKEQARETDRRIQETDRRIQETDRRMQETERLLKEQTRETDRQMKDTARKISNLGSRIGDLVEELIAPNIVEKFNKLGYAFGKVAPRVRYQDVRGEYIAEVDLQLEDGDVLLATEVKTQLTVADVREHIKRMEKLRRYADGHGDRRKLLGAVAGAIASREVKAFAVKSGFFVLEQSGDTVRISVPEGFKPREW